jgi:hypothetical protein
MLNVFADSRGDVRKIELSPADMEYDDRYLEDDETRDYIMNLIFFRTPSTWYNKLLERGSRLSDEAGMSSAEIRNIGREYFSSRYGS